MGGDRCWRVYFFVVVRVSFSARCHRGEKLDFVTSYKFVTTQGRGRG